MPGRLLALSVPENLFGRFLVACMTLGFAALIVTAGVAWWVSERNERYDAAVNHTYRVENMIGDVHRFVEQAETARRGYMLNPDPSFRRSFAEARSSLAPTLDTLAQLVGDNPVQQKALTAIRADLAQLTRQHDAGNALVERGDAAAAIALFRIDTGVQVVRDLRRVFRGMLTEERRLLALRDAEQRSGQRTFYIVLIVAVALLILLAAASALTVRRYTRDLTRSRATLQTLNDTLEHQVSIRTADLSRANEEIQRFAYIVSHDLRSPLVNVMGFTAELSAATDAMTGLLERAEATAPDIVSEDARLAVREDLPEAIGFIRASTQKMDRLINAILKLSREGRRTITPEPLDIASLVDGIGDTMHHRIVERDVTLMVARPVPDIVSDRLAIEQILSNLIENASKYLQPGRPGAISVSAEQRRDRVIVSVADNGRGIDARDHQRIFDLFRRSGQQDQPGEGIGLAHVRALAYRLGGTIDVDSALGEGSTFRLNLPATFSSQDIAS